MDHVFQVNDCKIAVVEGATKVLRIENLPLVESERDELVDFISSILQEEGILRTEGQAEAPARSTALGSKLRHLRTRRDPKRQLIKILQNFAWSAAAVVVNHKLIAFLPFHKLVKDSLR